MNGAARWTLVVALGAAVAFAVAPVPETLARGGGGGGGGRSGGKSKKGTGTVQGRADYLDDLQHEEAEEAAARFRDDATFEPVQRLRVADRGG